MLRLADGLREKVRIAAKAAGRSMNAEINLHLARAYDRTVQPIPRDDIREAMVEEARAIFGEQAMRPQAGTENPTADH